MDDTGLAHGPASMVDRRLSLQFGAQRDRVCGHLRGRGIRGERWAVFLEARWRQRKRQASHRLPMRSPATDPAAIVNSPPPAPTSTIKPITEPAAMPAMTPVMGNSTLGCRCPRPLMMLGALPSRPVRQAHGGAFFSAAGSPITLSPVCVVRMSASCAHTSIRAAPAGIESRLNA